MEKTEKIELYGIALAESESQPERYVLILEDQASQLRLPVLLGATEAQAIAIALQGIRPPRPLTHDLLANTLRHWQIALEEVLIYAYEESYFLTRLTLRKQGQAPQYLETGVADALALSFRLDAPIRVAVSVLKKCGLPVSAPVLVSNPWLQYDLNTLENLLQKFLAAEDYHKARQVRDAIAQKKKS
ncbi:MAG: bifunctional nuclease family protein [Microscillaceae bacterium]